MNTTNIINRVLSKFSKADEWEKEVLKAVKKNTKKTILPVYPVKLHKGCIM